MTTVIASLILDAADQIGDLRIPPGNRLEKLKGDRANTYSTARTTSSTNVPQVTGASGHLASRAVSF